MKAFISGHSFRTDIAQPAKAQDLFHGTLEVTRPQVGIDQSGHHARWAPGILRKVHGPKTRFVRIQCFLEKDSSPCIVASIPTHLGQAHAMHALAVWIQPSQGAQKHLQPDRIGQMKGRAPSAVLQQEQVGQLAQEIQIAQLLFIGEGRVADQRGHLAVRRGILDGVGGKQPEHRWIVRLKFLPTAQDGAEDRELRNADLGELPG